MHEIPIKNSRILVVGITFKENYPDVRNTKVVDLIHNLQEYGMRIDVVDIWADPNEVKHEYQLQILTKLAPQGDYQVIILAVPHRDTVGRGAKAIRALVPDGLFFDLKAAFHASESDIRL
jgi:UDP-N-acetyl-D-galactosamine dehydrogenase